MTARIIQHHREQWWAVEFFGNDGRRYRTLFTTWWNEAIGWLECVENDGWTISGRPYRAHESWEDYVAELRCAA